MALVQYRLRAVSPATNPNVPHIVGFQNPRSALNDTIFEAWNGPTNGDRVFVIDKDGALILGGHMMISGSRELLNVSLAINEQTGTSYTLALSDAGKIVRCANSGPIGLTVPNNTTVAFPVGTVIGVRQGGSGQITIGGEGGVTINSYLGANVTAGQYAGATLHKIDTNLWELDGVLTS